MADVVCAGESSGCWLFYLDCLSQSPPVCGVEWWWEYWLLLSSCWLGLAWWGIVTVARVNYVSWGQLALVWLVQCYVLAEMAWVSIWLWLMLSCQRACRWGWYLCCTTISVQERLCWLVLLVREGSGRTDMHACLLESSFSMFVFCEVEQGEPSTSTLSGNCHSLGGGSSTRGIGCWVSNASKWP